MTHEELLNHPAIFKTGRLSTGALAVDLDERRKLAARVRARLKRLGILRRCTVCRKAKGVLLIIADEQSYGFACKSHQVVFLRTLLKRQSSITKPTKTGRVSKAQLAYIERKIKSGGRFHGSERSMSILSDLHIPLQSALKDVDKMQRSDVIHAVYRHIYRTKRSYKAWHELDWIECYRNYEPDQNSSFRQVFVLASYRLTGSIIVDGLFGQKQLLRVVDLARKIFKRAIVDRNISLICDTLLQVGYTQNILVKLPPAIAEIMLLLGEADVRRWENPIVKAQSSTRYVRFSSRVHAISIALAELGVIADPTSFRKAFGFAPHRKIDYRTNVAPEWCEWADRWSALSTNSPRTVARDVSRVKLAGRWLWACHPDITSPAQWNTQLAAEFVAAVCKWRVGDYLDPLPVNLTNVGEELKPLTKRGFISSLRAYFQSLHDLELVVVRFNPATAFKLPKSISSQIDYAPRVLADDVWAKLLFAGINLRLDQLPKHIGYPLELIRAITINWLFGGLRNDEIMRLEVGCVEREAAAVNLITGETKPEVCFLRVPSNKYKGSYTKPVDRIIADAVDAWESVRPKQRKMLDSKTRRLTNRLLAYRGRPVGRGIINLRLIPLLCKIAGVPEADAIGRITSHRARSTIASQLYNADVPLGLLELRDWLGHTKLESVLAYAKADRNKLSRAYADADYFKRNLGRVSVLLDQEVIESGRAALGETYKYYDLGHGYCTYNFFSECAHRMACVRCSFYLPKESESARLLEAKSSNQRLSEQIPLREREREAVLGDAMAIEEMVLSLRGVASPDGLTPSDTNIVDVTTLDVTDVASDHPFGVQGIVPEVVGSQR